MPVTPRPVNSVVLTALRRRKGWTEEDLAAADGISSDMVSLYETKREPSRETLDRLAGRMGTKPELVAFLLFSLETADPPAAGPRSPVDPSPTERQRIREVAVQTCLANIALTESHSIKIVRARRARKARRHAEEVCRRLLAQTAAERRLSVEKEEETWAVAERLAHESERAAPASAARALELASLAVRTAELSQGDEVWLSRILGYAWIFLASAERVGGRLSRSDQAFAQARKLWDEGAAADPGLLAEWRIFDGEASLRRQQERFAQALKLHAQALQVAPREAEGRILLNQAITLEQMGEAERALTTLSKAESLIDGQREPRQLFGVRFHRIASLCRLGRHEEGAAMLGGVRDLAIDHRLELDLVRVLWLNAKICAGLGQQQEAVSALEQVRRAFLAHRIPYDFAEASLDLAALHRSQGRMEEVKALVPQMEWIFTTEEVPDEAKKALRFFCEVALQDRLTEELLQRLLDYLHRARHNPRLQFEA
jgi:tetratricopeptide (TPR) repeat protein